MSKMYKLSMVFLIILLTGCDYVPTTEQYDMAKKWCDDFGGIKTVTYSSLGGLRARCNDSKLIIDESF